MFSGKSVIAGTVLRPCAVLISVRVKVLVVVGRVDNTPLVLEGIFVVVVRVVLVPVVETVVSLVVVVIVVIVAEVDEVILAVGLAVVV